MFRYLRNPTAQCLGKRFSFFRHGGEFQEEAAPGRPRNMIGIGIGSIPPVPSPLPPTPTSTNTIDNFAKQSLRLWVQQSKRRMSQYLLRRLSKDCFVPALGVISPYTPPKDIVEYVQLRVNPMVGRFLSPEDAGDLVAAAVQADRNIDDFVTQVEAKPIERPTELNDALLGYSTAVASRINLLETAILNKISNYQSACKSKSRGDCKTPCQKGVFGCGFTPPLLPAQCSFPVFTL